MSKFLTLTYVFFILYSTINISLVKCANARGQNIYGQIENEENEGDIPWNENYDNGDSSYGEAAPLDEGGAEESNSPDNEISDQDLPESEKKQEWVIKAGQNLQEVLSEWCELSGWTLIWDTTKYMEIAADSTIFGSFYDAIEIVFSSLNNTNAPFVAEKYLANNVLRIRER